MIKLIRITTSYEAYIKQFYARHLELSEKSYAEQKAALDYDGFGWADFWSHALKPLGYEVMEVIANIEPLQRAWARENGIAFRPKTWLWDIPFAQVKKFQPTILFMNEHSKFLSEWISEVKQGCPSILKVFGWCGTHLHDPRVVKAWDVILCCIPEIVEHFRAEGFKSIHMHHAFEPRLIDRLSCAGAQNIDLSFVGSIVRAHGFHAQREKILLELVSQIPIQIYTPNADWTWQDELKTMAKARLYDIIKALNIAGIHQSTLIALPIIGRAATWPERPQSQIHPRLRPFMKAAVFGLEMFQTLRNSKTTLNSHLDASWRSASNMRLFEATGIGTCLVTDWKDNLAELFALDQEVVTYRSVDECVEKVRWLLEHPQEREAIAKAGQARTLKDHTFSRRAVQLNEIIEDQIKLARLG